MVCNKDHPDKQLQLESASYSKEDEAAQPEAEDHFDLPSY